MTSSSILPLLEAVENRRNTNSLKWDSASQLLSPAAAACDPLPMWVADMDFKPPRPVIEAMVRAAETAVFGYSSAHNPSYLEAVRGWQKRRFGFDVAPEWIVPVSGVITALKTIIQAFSNPGDSVLIQPPVYAHFHDDVLLNGRFPAFAPLQRRQGGYSYDPEVFEAAIRPNTRIFILSNPHNPTGNVWSEEELRSMGEICARHGILVISDEIHQDLILNPACRHVPFASLSPELADISITCTAPSKTFNLPGLQCANAFIPNPRLKGEFQRQLERNLYPRVNAMGLVAAEAAYRHGEPWLDALLEQVRSNHAHFSTAINGLKAGIEVLPADALYLTWMDCRGLGMDAAALEHFMLTKARLWLDKGQKFGVEGHGYMRINLGCPRPTVEEAIERLQAALAAHKNG
ncbi:MalY/PatB family protein [Allorhizobium undicola]|uniref:MalY/PatB family protein n=1 Tax=Allorhizobium undicola TaxID=78527 RepID=UPI003D34794D